MFCRWHLVTVTIDADLGEATSFIDGNYDGYQNGLPLPTINGIWEPGTDIWVGARPPIDLDAFGRSDSEGSDSKMQIMDAFLWGRCLSEDEVAHYIQPCHLPSMAFLTLHLVMLGMEVILQGY